MALAFCFAWIYEKLGRHADAERMLAKLRAEWGDDGALFYALIYAQWGDTGRALDWLEAAMRHRDPYLVYVKTNVLQVVQGEMFALPQNKANQWIHTLLPVLQATLRSLGDAPARSMEHLAQRLGLGDVPTEPMEPETVSQASPPLFAMMEPNDASSAPKIRINKQAIIAARKNATR